MEEAASALKLQVLVLSANSDGEIEEAFETLAQQHVGALAIGTAPFFDTRRAKLLALQFQHRLATAYAFREYAVAGGLMSYGSSLAAESRASGVYTGRILKGEKPINLPVQQVTKLELILNLKSAKFMEMAIPTTLVDRADRIIE